MTSSSRSSTSRGLRRRWKRGRRIARQLPSARGGQRGLGRHATSVFDPADRGTPAKLAAVDGQKVQKQAELRTIVATVQKLELVLPVLQQRVEIREVLYNHSTGSKANYLELYQTLVETQQELAVQRSRSREAKAAPDTRYGSARPDRSGV